MQMNGASKTATRVARVKWEEVAVVAGALYGGVEQL